MILLENSARIVSHILNYSISLDLEQLTSYICAIVKFATSLLEELTKEQVNFLKAVMNNRKRIEMSFRVSRLSLPPVLKSERYSTYRSLILFEVS